MTLIVLKRHYNLAVSCVDMLTTATKTCSIWTSHVNTGKRCVNVVTFVVVRILCNYHDIIVIVIILSVLSRYRFSHYRPGLPISYS